MGITVAEVGRSKMFFYKIFLLKFFVNEYITLAKKNGGIYEILYGAVGRNNPMSNTMRNPGCLIFF